MNKYIVVEAGTAEEISAEVTKKLNAPGWFLVGGLSVVHYVIDEKSYWNYSQAMVYDEDQLRKLAAARAGNRNRHHPARPAAPEPPPPSTES